MKLEKSLDGIVPALCYDKLFFVTSIERHKVSVHISDLFNSGGSGDIAMSLESVRRPSVRPYVRKHCPLHNLNTIWNILMILHSYVEQVITMCRVPK